MFAPTHTIELAETLPLSVVDKTSTGALSTTLAFLSIPVHADLDAEGNGPLYTESEWGAEVPADWELIDGNLHFQGKLSVRSRLVEIVAKPEPTEPVHELPDASDASEDEPTVVKTPSEVELIEQAVAAALDHPDPDGPTVEILAARRDLSCKGSGPEEYRRVRYPGRDVDEWPDCDRLPPPRIRASDRRCRVMCEVPVGTIVIAYDREVYHGKRGKCSVTIGVAIKHPLTGEPHVQWYDHKTLRSRPVYQVALPGGHTVEILRREHK